MKRIVIEKSTYLDSVSLMRISKKASEAAGVANAMVAMATDTNLALMAEVGFDASEVQDVTANDLMIALDAEDEATLGAALEMVRGELKGGAPTGSEESRAPGSLESAMREYPEINLVLISVPGQFAAYEAMKALRSNKHVMIFSDNVSIEDERELKTVASKRGLLLMGPDCGTAIINGAGLGFANSVPAGKIGMVAASGTGAQEVSAILARNGLGISQLIGTGGRDVAGTIGGVTTIMGLKALIDDPETEVIAVVSKLPDEKVAKKILKVARGTGKPCIIYFAGQSESRRDANLVFTRTLAETAAEAALAAGGRVSGSTRPDNTGTDENLLELRCTLDPSRKYLRGLFSGGTLAQEAAFILGRSLDTIHTNLKLPGLVMLDDPGTSTAHTIVDLGDDVFTRGRAHPMIDQSYRLTRLAKEVSDGETAVILLDVVLGYGCSADPAGEIAGCLAGESGENRRGPGGPIVIASICGTHQDPQGYDRQRQALLSAGVLVAETNAQACELARKALGGESGE
ncbi:MAG: acyl-CoA synthetase FdrA [Candidatus Eisenbacteria bacterium]